MWETWWVWIAGGFVLGILEIMVPGYVFLGFALGAVLTGGLLWLGVLPAGTAVLLLVFALASLVAWLGLRAALGRRTGQVKLWDRDINDN